MTTPPLNLLVDADPKAIPIHAMHMDAVEGWLAAQPPRVRNWVTQAAFKGDMGSAVVVPGEDGTTSMVVLGLGRGDEPWATGNLARTLPKGTYRLASMTGVGENYASWIAMAWALGGYSFLRYKSEPAPPRAALVWPEGANRDYVTRTVAGIVLARDLVNTPAADMLPDALERAARELAAQHGATVTVITGDDLLTQNYPMIHAVGRASSVAPRLIDITWDNSGGDPATPKVTLVGKGVCFDSGGLDLKTSSGMALMKKDMGGAAAVLGLAHIVMAAKTNTRLRVLIPAVENAVAGNAFRPGDVLKTRKGMTVEIGNTDAEGRLVLADALTEAASEKPALLIDFATLTGACRVALGTEIPGLFVDDETLAVELAMASRTTYDPFWRLPLHTPYRKMLDSKVADINNAGEGGFAGAITAALFLKEFIPPGTPWVHIDTYAWNANDRPGRPAGGEALGIRAIFALIRSHLARNQAR